MAWVSHGPQWCCKPCAPMEAHGASRLTGIVHGTLARRSSLGLLSFTAPRRQHTRSDRGAVLLALVWQKTAQDSDLYQASLELHATAAGPKV